MERFQVIKAVRISKDTDGNALENSYYQLSLQNQAGDVLEQPVRMSTKYIANLFNQEQVDTTVLTPRQLHRLIKGMTILATIEQKVKGEEFVATEFSGLVNVGTDKAPKWEQPVKGQKYLIQEDGYRVNYDNEVGIDFNDDLADKFIREATMPASVQAAPELASVN